MRIMRPRIGFALVGAAVLATTVTSFAVAAQSQSPGEPCYSTCPAKVDLKVTYRALDLGDEQDEVFSVVVRAAAIGVAEVPTGSVTVKTGSTVLCTVILVRGRGRCSPAAGSMPAGEDVVIAVYNGDADFSSAESHAEDVDVSGVASGD